MIFLSEQETAALVDEDLALAAARVAFTAMATGGTVFPSVIAHSSDPVNRFAVESVYSPKCGVK